MRNSSIKCNFFSFILYRKKIINYFSNKVKDVINEVEIYDKVSSKLCKIKDTNIYMKFR